MNLSLLFEDNGTAHDDLVLTLNSRTYRCDSYYLALDQELLPDREDALKVRLVLRRLLEQWRDALESMRDATLYLPYDFSDQATGWLAVSRGSSDKLSITHGWSSVEGWSLMPSDISQHVLELREFQPDTDPVLASPSELLAAVRASIVATQASQAGS